MGGIHSEIHLGKEFEDAVSSGVRYNIYSRAIDFDVHAGRLISDQFDKNVDRYLNDLGSNPGPLSWANHEYVEIMKENPVNGQERLDTRFQGLGLVNDPSHPTGFRMTPDDRLVTMVSNTENTAVTMDPIFYDDAHFDQDKYPGQLQEVEHPGENKLVMTVNEEQMLQIKLAMLSASNQINRDNPGFGLTGWGDPNSNSYRNTMGAVIKETAGLMGIKADTAFDPDGASPGSGQRIPTASVKLFEGSIEELRQAVKDAEQTNAGQLATLRQDINANLNETEPDVPQNSAVSTPKITPPGL